MGCLPFYTSYRISASTRDKLDAFWVFSATFKLSLKEFSAVGAILCLEAQRMRRSVMTTRKSKRQRFWLPVIVLALAVALALGGCARGGQAGGPSSSGQTTTQNTTGSSAGASGQNNTQQELQNLQGVSQQNQNDLNGLGDDDNNTNQNQGNDQETQP
jgi:hypothetical protein